jgi:uncharacterized protein YcbX
MSMTDPGQVAALWRYPVSSLGGQPMRELSFGSGGAEGDRSYGLFDVESGIVAAPDRNPAKWDQAPRVRTRLSDEGGLEVAAPDGGWLAAPAAQSDKAISDYLGFEVAVRSYLDEGPQPADGSAIAPRYRRAPVHLLTTASLARLKALHPAGDPDPRRFRPSIVIDMPEVEGEFPESGWLGRRLAIGDVELTISAPCRRCGFTVIAQDGFDNDPGILRTLVRHNGHNIGVYCTVDRPGRIELSEPMRFL